MISSVESPATGISSLSNRPSLAACAAFGDCGGELVELLTREAPFRRDQFGADALRYQAFR